MPDPTDPADADIDPTPEARSREVNRRLGLVRNALESRGADAVLLRLRHNFAWLTLGGDNHILSATETGATFVLVTATDSFVVAPNNEEARIRDEEISGLPLGIETIPWHEPAAADAFAQRRSRKRVATEAELEGDLVGHRSALGPIEHARLRWIGERVVEAIDAAADGVNEGDSEESAIAVMEESLTRKGIRSPVTLAAADERIVRYRHPLPTAHPVRKRLMLIVVGERWGLNVALTRMRDLAPPAAETARRQALTETVLERMRAASVPGTTLGEVLAETQRAYADAGFPDEWKLHHQGGSIGYRSREVIATPGNEAPIVDGMAFAWNPSITGAKAESTFYLAGGTDTVTVAE
jgi:Xaa-Pro aminopeptidase